VLLCISDSCQSKEKECNILFRMPAERDDPVGTQQISHFSSHISSKRIMKVEKSAKIEHKRSPILNSLLIFQKSSMI